MANQKTLKKRISSVKNIGKITKALEMVSASKVQHAQESAQNTKPYAQQIYDLTHTLSQDQANRLGIPLLRQPENANNILYVIVSTNRGLIGSLNTNLLRELKNTIDNDNATHRQFITIGKKAQNFALKNGELIADYSDDNADVSAITTNIVDLFTAEKIDKVIFVYSNFISALEYQPTFKQLLPIGLEEQSEEKSDAYNFEPDAHTLLNEIIPFYLEVQIRNVLTQAQASEHSARMMAMKNASDNAQGLGSSLALYYNKIRQQSITNEINEITTAGLALN